jgi:phosphoserine phosphatase
VFDIGPALIQQEVIDEIPSLVGFEAQVSAITAAAMDGELNFEAGLRRWCVLLKGVLSGMLETPKLRVTLNKGVLDQTKALKRLGLRMVVLSRGFTLLTV